MEREQFNVRLEKNLKRKVAKDRAATAKTNDIIVAVALENLFTGCSLEKRRKFYDAHHRKPYEKKTA